MAGGWKLLLAATATVAATAIHPNTANRCCKFKNAVILCTVLIACTVSLDKISFLQDCLLAIFAGVDTKPMIPLLLLATEMPSEMPSLPYPGMVKLPFSSHLISRVWRPLADEVRCPAPTLFRKRP